jgi:hypothetical protein
LAIATEDRSIDAAKNWSEFASVDLTGRISKIAFVTRVNQHRL